MDFIVPDMKGTFGRLEYAGDCKVEQKKEDGRMKVISRTYALFSDRQRADNVEVILPASAGEKHFEYEEPVKLIKPKILVAGIKIGDRGYANYILEAEDMVKQDGKEGQA